MKKVKTIADIKVDVRIDEFIQDYDGKGRHMVGCKIGYRFESFNSTIEIGNIKELCYEINERLKKEEDRPEDMDGELRWDSVI